MREARDTWLHYLADNLNGITVRNLRQDPTSPDLAHIMTNALNIQFLGSTPKVRVSSLNCSMDLVHESEIAAQDMLISVMDLLQTTGMTTLLNYSDPTNPAALWGNLFWDVDKIRFRQVPNALYYRYSGMVTLFYHHTNERNS